MLLKLRKTGKTFHHSWFTRSTRLVNSRSVPHNFLGLACSSLLTSLQISVKHIKKVWSNNFCKQYALRMLFFKGFSPNSQENVKYISMEPEIAILKQNNKQKKRKKNLLLTMSKIKIWGATFNMFENSQKE